MVLVRCRRTGLPAFAAGATCPCTSLLPPTHIPTQQVRKQVPPRTYPPGRALCRLTLQPFQHLAIITFQVV